MISERLLRKWRKEALKVSIKTELHLRGNISGLISLCTEQNKSVLKMTQELLDLHLINKEKKSNGKVQV